jgi:hypothetical protein
VTAGRVELGHHRDVRTRIMGLDRRAHSCAAGSDHKDVVRRFHRWGTLHE